MDFRMHGATIKKNKKRSIPFGYFRHLMVQGHQDAVLFFMESLQFVPGMLKDQENVIQEFS
jgi:hypothetical protein